MAKAAGFSFGLDEVPLRMPNGEKLYASGDLPIEYKIQGPEPDVGLMHSWPEWDLARDEVALTCFDQENARSIRLAIRWNDPLMSQIVDDDKIADQIAQACLDDDAAYGGPDPDDARDDRLERLRLEQD